jgi:hypothetical protein
VSVTTAHTDWQGVGDLRERGPPMGWIASPFPSADHAIIVFVRSRLERIRPPAPPSRRDLDRCSQACSSRTQRYRSRIGMSRTQLERRTDVFALPLRDFRGIRRGVPEGELRNRNALGYIWRLRGSGMKRVLLTLLFLTSASSLLADDGGLFLCRSPMVANDFYSDLLAAQRIGIEMDMRTWANIGKKHECPFVQSPDLKPVDVVAGQLAFALPNGTRGFAAPQVYTAYVNRPRRPR